MNSYVERSSAGDNERRYTVDASDRLANPDYRQHHALYTNVRGFLSVIKEKSYVIDMGNYRDMQRRGSISTCQRSIMALVWPPRNPNSVNAFIPSLAVFTAGNEPLTPNSDERIYMKEFEIRGDSGQLLMIIEAEDEEAARKEAESIFTTDIDVVPV